MGNELKFGEIFSKAFATMKKRYLPQFAVSAIARFIGVVLTFTILIIAIVRMMSVNVLDIPTEGAIIMGIAAAVIGFMLIFIDTFVTAVVVVHCEKKLRQALKFALKKVHRIFVVSFMAAAAYFLIVFIAFVILGLIWAQFTDLQIAAMVNNRVNLAIVLVVAAICLFSLLLVNNIFMLLTPLTVDGSQPLLGSIDESIKGTFKKGRILQLMMFNIVCKLPIVVFYAVIYFVVISFVELPTVLTAPAGYEMINTVMWLLLTITITYLVGTIIAPISKNIVCALRAFVNGQ